jgi:hypothetical protein
MGWSSIFRVLGAQQQEHLIDPLKGTTCHSKDLNLGGEGNNHSSQPPKLHPMDRTFISSFFSPRSQLCHTFFGSEICLCMPKLFKIYSRDPILKNLSKYHVLLSFFNFFLSIPITYFSHLSPLSISTLNHFFSLSLHPLHSLIPHPPILSHISIYGGGRTPTTLLHPSLSPSSPPLPLSTFLPPHFLHLHFSPSPLTTHLFIGFTGLHFHPLSYLISCF